MVGRVLTGSPAPGRSERTRRWVSDTCRPSRAAVLRVRDGRGEAVGLGFLVAPDLALTCAHVVSAALGLRPQERPATAARLEVDLPLRAVADANGAGVAASVERWLPAREAGGGDVAVLRLEAPLPGGRPVRLIEAEEVWEHPVRAFGFPAGRPGGVWHAGVLRAEQAHGWVQADLAGLEWWPGLGRATRRRDRHDGGRRIGSATGQLGPIARTPGGGAARRRPHRAARLLSGFSCRRPRTTTGSSRSRWRAGSRTSGRNGPCRTAR
ncbi:serine protease [Kitasatospora sp. MMS16-BH015]|uniref:S1 family peptidase n=1 Tax=Kitasatospora sp. MMS16-BH015 TaxID=2018025 RepID=UPI000CF22F03